MALRVSIACLFYVVCQVALLQERGTGQTTGRTPRPLVIASMYGRDLFEFYCAPCHGRDGKGSGPVAPALKTVPADLTGLAARNGGAFPRARITALLAGDREADTTAHGPKEMPVWGPIFRALDPGDTTNKVRIANIVDYLDSLQKPR